MFTDYIKTDEIIFKHAKGMRDIKGKEFHIYNEVLLLIDKEAEFASDTINQIISGGALVIIPKEHYHQFELICAEEDYHRYILQFETISKLENLIQETINEVKVIPTAPQKIVTLFDMLAASQNNMSEDDKKILLNSVCAQILLEIKYSTDSKEITVSNEDAVVREILAYINQHFLENITVKAIANELNYSETYVSHRFKKMLHTSVYNYILQKKLIYAYNLIRSGTSATDAAATCGFKEYSGFYKIFKKHFGFSPSKIE